MSKVVPSIIQYLKQLSKNNQRGWFQEHKKSFKDAEKNIKQFMSSVMEKLNESDQLDSLKLFRIYRDVRFSKDKTPYKTHFGCSFHRIKPALRGGYYVHIQPDNESFIAAGFWQPNKEDLFRIRKEFEIDDTRIRKILNQKSFKENWGDFHKGEELKTAPKGFNKEHKAIDLIRKKQYVFVKNFSDNEVLYNQFLTQINKAFLEIRPYFDYMSEVLTTNLNGESIID